jgi:hypothetical protein
VLVRRSEPLTHFPSVEVVKCWDESGTQIRLWDGAKGRVSAVCIPNVFLELGGQWYLIPWCSLGRVSATWDGWGAVFELWCGYLSLLPG